MADFNAIAQAFVSHYYQTFDNKDARKNLASLYRPESMLLWEGRASQGTAEIIGALTKTDLGTVKHQVQNHDVTPSVNGGVLIQVTGTMIVDNAFDKPMNFSTTFSLQPVPQQPGAYFVYSQIFRLIFA